MPVSATREKRGAKQRDRYTTAAANVEAAENVMSVCEVPLLSGLPRLLDIQTSEPTAWRVASDHVSIQTNTRLASSQLNPVFRALSSTGRSWASATDLNLDNARVNRATSKGLNL